MHIHLVTARYRTIEEKMMAHGESRLVSRVKRAGQERRHVESVFRRRCVDLDFSILEIEMMRHIIGHTHRETTSP